MEVKCAKPVLILLFITSGVLFYCSIFIDQDIKPLSVPKFQEIQLSEREKRILDDIILIAKDVHHAEKHSWGLKTSASLRAAKIKLKKVLKYYDISYENITKPFKNRSVSVCPEKYMGTKYGYPYYQTGFVVQNCSYGQPLSNLITVVVNFRSQNISSIQKLLSSIKKHDSSMKIIANIGSKLKSQFSELKSKYASLKLVQEGDNVTLGHTWNKMIARVETKYLLISRGITELDEHSRIDRLIRELEIQNKTIATGAIRNRSNGKWEIGCYQRAFRNYTLVYYAGYDESVHECLVCDHVDGPVIMKTSFFNLTSNRFNEKFNRYGLFEEFFIRHGTEQIINCPDAMFHVEKMHTSRNPVDWKKFSNSLDIWKLKFVPGFELVFPCVKPYRCYKGKYYSIHPCCVRELTEMTLLCMDICDSAQAVCELDSGTQLAGVKMGNSFPWDYDGDVAFVSRNYTSIALAASKVKTFKLRSISKPKRAKNGQQGGGFMQMDSSNWFIEVWGMPSLTSEKYILEGKDQTKILLGGKWVHIGNNPGLMVRNRYGLNCYRHSVHWRYLGFKTSWLNYKTKAFSKCKTPGNHKCMDLFRTDGNLQFSDPLP